MSQINKPSSAVIAASKAIASKNLARHLPTESASEMQIQEFINCAMSGPYFVADFAPMTRDWSKPAVYFYGKNRYFERQQLAWEVMHTGCELGAMLPDLMHFVINKATDGDESAVELIRRMAVAFDHHNPKEEE